MEHERVRLVLAYWSLDEKRRHGRTRLPEAGEAVLVASGGICLERPMPAAGEARLQDQEQGGGRPRNYHGSAWVGMGLEILVLEIRRSDVLDGRGSGLG